MLNADDLVVAHEFAIVNFNDCDKFANNVIHLDKEKLPAV